ncbi:MAG: Nif11-like leader peptide family RiPP precursor [Syntrophomonas sp.]|nr:Nif11-like leader peptide family RiPP precursor [Syntrophomonas sp.]
MSKGAKEFVEKLNADKEFAAQFWAQKTDKEKEAFVNAAGFSFSEEDAKAAFAATPLNADKMQPLSHDQLETVAGGTCDQCSNGWRW